VQVFILQCTGLQWPTEYRKVRYSNGHFSDTFWVRLSNVPSYNVSGPDISASLDRFGMKKIFLWPSLIKRSRLANRTRMSGFRMVRYSNAQDWHKIKSEYRPRFGIRWVTVNIFVQATFHSRLQWTPATINLCYLTGKRPILRVECIYEMFQLGRKTYFYCTTLYLGYPFDDVLVRVSRSRLESWYFFSWSE
jgi:hypothetical protein